MKVQLGIDYDKVFVPRRSTALSLIETGCLSSLYSSDKWELGRKSFITASWKDHRATQYKGGLGTRETITSRIVVPETPVFEPSDRDF